MLDKCAYKFRDFLDNAEEGIKNNLRKRLINIYYEQFRC